MNNTKTQVINKIIYILLTIIMGIGVIDLGSKITMIKANRQNTVSQGDAVKNKSVYASTIYINGKEALNIVNKTQAFMLISQAKKLLMNRYKLYNVNASNIKLKDSIMIKRNKVTKSSINSYSNALKRLVSNLNLKWEEKVENYFQIPYTSKVNTNSKLLKGSITITQKGINGQKLEQRLIEKENGKIIAKRLLTSKVIKEPITEYKVIGTAQPNTINNTKTAENKPDSFDSKAATAFSSLDRSQNTSQEQEGDLAIEIAGIKSTFSKPVTGFLSSKFGIRWGKMHDGVDLGADYGQDIRAAYSGKVIYSTWCNGYGNLIEIELGYGYTTYYGHCSAILVKDGESVVKGQVIGRVGSTGHSTGPHLHFEIRKDGVPINPWPFIRKYYA